MTVKFSLKWKSAGMVKAGLEDLQVIVAEALGKFGPDTGTEIPADVAPLLERAAGVMTAIGMQIDAAGGAGAAPPPEAAGGEAAPDEVLQSQAFKAAVINALGGDNGFEARLNAVETTVNDPKKGLFATRIHAMTAASALDPQLRREFEAELTTLAAASAGSGS